MYILYVHIYRILVENYIIMIILRFGGKLDVQTYSPFYNISRLYLLQDDYICLRLATPKNAKGDRISLFYDTEIPFYRCGGAINILT